MIPARKTILILASASALLGGAASIAATLTPKQAAQQRHSNFEKMGKAMKAIGGELKSGAPNRGVIVANARTIAAIAPQQTRLFPAGSGPSPSLRTHALPAIWTDRATFDALGTKLVNESAKFAGMAPTADFGAIGAQMKVVGGTCGECHRKFREED